MKQDLINRPKGTDGKAILGSDNTTALNDLEKVALNDLGKDKINPEKIFNKMKEILKLS